MLNFREALLRPFSDITKFLIGVILGIIPIANFFVYGYFLRCGAHSMKRRSELPDWDKWGELFLHGIMVFIMALIYLIPLIIIIWITSGSGFLLMFKGDFNQLATAIDGLYYWVWAFAILYFYTLPAGLILFAHSNDFAEGLKFWKAFSWHYLVAWLLAFVTCTFIFIILSIIPYFGIMGLILAMFINPVITMTLLGQSLEGGW